MLYHYIKITIFENIVQNLTFEAKNISSNPEIIDLEQQDKSFDLIKIIPNDENSIEIDVYTIADETVHKMEAFYNTGIEQFRQLFLDTKFKCSKIEYHEKTGRIKYILFEQVN